MQEKPETDQAICKSLANHERVRMQRNARDPKGKQKPGQTLKLLEPWKHTKNYQPKGEAYNETKCTSKGQSLADPSYAYTRHPARFKNTIKILSWAEILAVTHCTSNRLHRFRTDMLRNTLIKQWQQPSGEKN